MSKYKFEPGQLILAQDESKKRWHLKHFSHMRYDTFKTTDDRTWKVCIPFDETTKHLIGTTDPYVDPTESPVFEFGDIVEGVDESGELLKGIFSYAQSNDYWGEVLVKGEGSTRTFYMRTARLLRKGNFNS